MARVYQSPLTDIPGATAGDVFQSLLEKQGFADIGPAPGTGGGRKMFRPGGGGMAGMKGFDEESSALVNQLRALGPARESQFNLAYHADVESGRIADTRDTYKQRLQQYISTPAVAGKSFGGLMGRGNFTI